MKRDHCERADIWSIGVIFYLLLTNSHPLEYLTEFVDIKNLKQTVISVIESSNSQKLVNTDHAELQELPAEVRELLEKMLKVNPAERLSITDRSVIKKQLSTLYVKRKKSLSEVSDCLTNATTLDCSGDFGGASPRSPTNSKVQTRLKLYLRLGIK